MMGRLKNKALVFGAVIILLLTVLSSVYATYSFDESIERESIGDENIFDRESFLDRYDASEQSRRPRHYPLGSQPLHSPTTIDGEEWDIVVPDDYSSIQVAVNKADEGYHIFVRSGVYKENITIDIQSLVLQGENKEYTIIDGYNQGNVISITRGTEGVNISGFTIKNSAKTCSGLNVSSDYNIIHNTILENNGNGLDLYYSSGNQIEDNQIINNENNGIYFHRSSGNELKDNTIKENKGNGIKLSYSSIGITINNNSISSNEHCGIFINESSFGNTIKENTIQQNDHGIKCIGNSDGNMFHHNRFISNTQNAYDTSMNQWDYGSMGNYWDDYNGVDADGDGIGDIPYNISGGDNIDRYPLINQIMMNDYRDQDYKNRGFDESIKILTNKASSSSDKGWDITVPDDYNTIQEAINQSNEGDQILVKRGTYNENLVIDKPSLLIQGENKDSVIIDGDKNTFDVVKILSPGVEVSGFRIYNSGKGCSGIISLDMSSIITECNIENCTYGVSLFLADNHWIKNCSFMNNEFGINICNSRDNQIRGNIIKNNGEGIASTADSSADFLDNIVQNNTFNGFLLIGHKDSTIKNNIIKNNGLDRWFGIQLMHNSKNNTIKNNNIRNNSHDGISLSKSQGNNLTRNNVNANNGNGISLWFYSSDNTILNNSINFNNYTGIRLDQVAKNLIDRNYLKGNNRAIELRFSNNNHLRNNSILENIYGLYMYDFSNNNKVNYCSIYDQSSSGIMLIQSFDNIINKGTYENMKLSSSNNNSISNCNITKSIEIIDSSYNKVHNNHIYDSYDGVYIESSSFNDIRSNIIEKNDEDGIDLELSYSNNISHNIVRNNSMDPYYDYIDDCFAIELELSFKNNIYANIISNNNAGISIWYSLDNRILENNFLSNGITIKGNELPYWNTHTIKNNYINENPIYYYKNQVHGNVIPSDAGQVIIVNSSNFKMSNLSLKNGDNGLSLAYSNNCTILNNTISNNNLNGLFLEKSSYNQLEGNSISENNNQGIELLNSSNNNLYHNQISRNHFNGIHLEKSCFNNIGENAITNNGNNGVTLDYSRNNNIMGNLIMNNNYGVYLTHLCDKQRINHNNFINNLRNAYDDNNNLWYCQEYFRGNYWDDYTGSDIDDDGIGDTPYKIQGLDESLKDMYPLMNKYSDSVSPIVRIKKPISNSIYIFKNRILPFFGTLIIGSIDIESTIIDDHTINKVEFYIDDELKKTDICAPYNYHWNELSFTMHNIKIIGYDKAGNWNSYQMYIWKIL